MGTLRKLIMPTLLGLALYFVIFGGEFSLFDLRRARAERAAAEFELDSLRLEIDSLRKWRDALEGDSATIERIARERYGMIRDGEVLYRYTEPEESTPRADTSRGR